MKPNSSVQDKVVAAFEFFSKKNENKNSENKKKENKMKILLIVLAGFVLVGCSSEKEITTKQQIIKIVEEAYAEGQGDAIEGDVRIEIVNDSQIVFTKTPWDECSDEGNFKCDASLFDTVTNSSN